jgi:glucosamine--fructose-6-phosphate aminotransferase (isomerizing)
MTSLMMQSILEQPKAIARVLEHGLGAERLDAAVRATRIRKIWIAGSGTSLFAAMIAARSWEKQLGIDCEAISSLEFLDETDPGRLDPGTMLVAVSQSGASLTLLEGIRRAKAAGALTVVVTAEPSAPIPVEAGFTVETHTGPESNLGKCKGFTTTAFATVLLGRRLAMAAGGEADAALRQTYAWVPGLFSATIERARPAAANWAQRLKGVDALYVVGAGANVPSAFEGALKVLEVAKMPVITKELEEMMHGPVNGVGPRTGIVVVADATARRDRLTALLDGIALLGNESLRLFASPDLAATPPDLLLPDCADEAVRAILAVVPFQLLAHDLAASRGAAIDTARYPQLYPVFASKSIHK